MDTKLGFEYDCEGDILYINKRSPYPEQESEEIDYGVIARLNPDTKEIENLEILFFSRRLSEKKLFELPIVADLRPSPPRNSWDCPRASLYPLMQFLATENFPRASVVYLRSAGYDVAYGSEDAPRAEDSFHYRQT